MDSTSASTFVASFQFQEVDYFIMLVMTAFLGWQIGEMLRGRFKNLPKSKASKLSQKKRISEDDMAVVPRPRCPSSTTQSSEKGTRCVPPTQTPAARASAGLEQLAAQDAPWRKMAPSTAPVAPREDTMPRELGRVVCWKETGYGFVVNEAGERLFARQAEVEGGEPLRAGQLIWFRRGKSQAGQAAKALNITIVSQEEAKVMRQSASTSKASSPKPANKALAFPSAPKQEVNVVPTPKIVPTLQESTHIRKDVDLSAFLGAGSKEEQIKNLKYAPQWVADKLWSQQAEDQEEL